MELLSVIQRAQIHILGSGGLAIDYCTVRAGNPSRSVIVGDGVPVSRGLCGAELVFSEQTSTMWLHHSRGENGDAVTCISGGRRGYTKIREGQDSGGVFGFCDYDEFSGVAFPSCQIGNTLARLQAY